MKVKVSKKFINGQRLTKSYSWQKSLKINFPSLESTLITALMEETQRRHNNSESYWKRVLKVMGEVSVVEEMRIASAKRNFSLYFNFPSQVVQKTKNRPSEGAVEEGLSEASV